MIEYQSTTIGSHIIKTACQRKMIQHQIIKTACQSRKIGLKQTRYDGNKSVNNQRQEIIMHSDLMRQLWRSIHYECQRSRSLFDFCSRSHRYVLSNSFCFKGAGLIKAKCYFYYWFGEGKVYSNDPGHVTKMTDTHII